MKYFVETTCSNSHLEKVDNQIFCFNCYGLYQAGVKKKCFEKIKAVMIHIYYILKYTIFVEIVEI